MYALNLFCCSLQGALLCNLQAEDCSEDWGRPTSYEHLNVSLVEAYSDRRLKPVVVLERRSEDWYVYGVFMFVLLKLCHCQKQLMQYCFMLLKTAAVNFLVKSHQVNCYRYQIKIK